MENKELGSKKINGKQDQTAITDPRDAAPALQPEIETNASGEKSIVQRARHTDQGQIIQAPESGMQSKPSTAPEALGKKMVENKDKNSDITATRYPNSHPENKQDRGNTGREK